MKNIHYALLSGVLLLLGGMAICCINPKRPSASDYVRIPSQAVAATLDTTLKEALEPEVSTHSGQSGFELVTKGKDSLQLRLAMIEAAERSIDIQYYMIEDDMTGKLLLEAILRAADRGVRVRILMDDLNLRGSDNTWPVLNVHRHIEIRIFNPFATRDEPLFTRVSNVFTGLGQFSKRMHNKILVVDNQVGIAGGRNLGNEYFDAGSDLNFRDVDVLAVGPIVVSMSRSFDSYWNGNEAFPLAALHIAGDDSRAIPKLREQLRHHWHEQVQKKTIVSTEPLAGQLREGIIPLLWSEAELAVDAPSKVDLPANRVSSKPGFRLDQIATRAQHEVVIVSPYFVPGDEGTQGLKALVAKGVKVRVLTNSLASTDAVGAHTGYRRYRQALVEGGIELYEMQPIGGTHPHSHRFSSSSLNSLHSKIYVVDRRDVLIGSFNLDPRSLNLNTEMVIVIHNPVLAAQVITMFEKTITPSTSFHLVMQDRHLEWLGEEEGQEKHYDSEPEAGMWRKIKADVFALLPFENQL